MLNPSVFLLLHKIVVNTELRVEILLYVHLAYIVEEIKIKVLHSRLFKLLFKDFFYLSHIGKIVTRKLGGNIKLVSGIFGKSLSHNNFRITVMITPCGIVIIDACGHCLVHHLKGFFFINAAVISPDYWQSHGAESKGRQFNIPVVFVNHILLPS